MDPKEQCFTLLEQNGIDKNSSIDFDVNGVVHTLSFEDIITTFMQASEDSKEFFFKALEQAANEKGIEKFFEGMGQLFLMSHLSEKL